MSSRETADCGGGNFHQIKNNTKPIKTQTPMLPALLVFLGCPTKIGVLITATAKKNHAITNRNPQKTNARIVSKTPTPPQKKGLSKNAERRWRNTTLGSIGVLSGNSGMLSSAMSQAYHDFLC
jgi:hypothetical protein